MFHLFIFTTVCYNNTKKKGIYMKLMIVELQSCGVNYQNDYISESLKKNYELTKNFKEADSIVMLGGCCCSDDNMYTTLMQINYILDNKKEDAVTYLAGCITRGFKNVDEFEELEKDIKGKINFVVKHYKSNELLELINKQSQESKKIDLTEGYGICEYNKTKANIYLQNGCTHNCSFCKSNYLKCDLIDMPMEKVKRYIDEINDEKIKNIQLIGLNLSQYGLGLYGEHRLMEICEYIEEKRNIKHVELGGLAFSDAIKFNFAEKLKYLRKIDLICASLESGSDRLLQLMNKGFTMKEFFSFYNEINSIEKKKFYLSIISGFPTETLDDCLETIKVLKQVRPKIVNINTFLDSTYVPSHQLELLDEKEIKEHTKIYTKALRRNNIKNIVNLGE